jgi:hypothetical protein
MNETRTKPAISIAVAGSGRKVGKTSFICGLIKATPEIHWTAVKITSHRHDKSEPVWEESAAGQGTDTARYLAAGARRALLVTAPAEHALPLAEIEAALGIRESVIFESNRIVDARTHDLCLAVIGGQDTERKPSFAAILERANALIGTSHTMQLSQLHERPFFVMQDMNDLSKEMTIWLRQRLAIGRS